MDDGDVDDDDNDVVIDNNNTHHDIHEPLTKAKTHYCFGSMMPLDMLTTAHPGPCLR